MTTSSFFTNPQEFSLAEVLDNYYPLFVPRYQRGYSWTDEEVAEFIADFNDVVRDLGKKAEQPHFMGTVLFVRRQTKRRYREYDHEVVDGQQRLTTFSLLLICIRNAYLGMAEKSKGAHKAKAIRAASRIDEHFLLWTEEGATRQRLTLSLANDEYFTALAARRPDEPLAEILKRQKARQASESDRRLQAAIRQLDDDFVRAHLKLAKSASARHKKLEDLERAVTGRARLLVLKTGSLDVGYELFSVINNRGRPLSEADLIRTRFIEEAERLRSSLPVGFSKQLEDLWSQVLQEGVDYSVDLLHAIWAGRTGKRWSSSRFVNEYISYCLPKRGETRGAPKKLVDAVSELRHAHLRFSSLVDGAWPFESSKVGEWLQQRLYLIVKALGHKQSLPYLLAAALHCDEKSFAKIVLRLDLFLFRYVSICKGHPSKLGDVLYAEARALSKTRGKKALESLSKALRSLLDEHAPMSKFEAGLKELRYSSRSARLIKYFLLTASSYKSSYVSRKDPVHFDQSITVDYDACWVEHIYPQEAQPAHRNEQLEALKHDLGNLTLGDQKGQRKSGNRPFAKKREWYKESEIRDTSSIGRLKQWTAKHVSDRRADLLARALVVWA